ncbi:hypothetical protein [Sandaracinus amylolyticus]|uniref:Lipoprotein n=1 Tax=Sandaracinus amylolyticus TaxID=927083 RepID=A0A0F6YJI1_9BACT|nr:hypothetical protein [Sandaracinus amylolyticus]AKF08095.1 hypothetical protein DB32_005244 [Sandaracinus amylolyticus]
MTRAGLACAALALVGCLMPDRSLIERDAGMDAPDTSQWEDAGDAGEDAGDGGCRTDQQFERTCDNGEDDDCDGLVDCNDFDCGRELECCGSGGESVVSEFATDSLDWVSLPIGVPPAIQRETTDDVVSSFGTGDPRGLRYVECLPVDLGMSITATLRAPRGTACATREGCEYASIVLTAVPDMARGASLPDELSVRVYRDRIVEVRRAGRVIDTAPQSFGIDDVNVTIELSPGVSGGAAWIFARVLVAQTGVDTWDVFADSDDGGRRALIPREHLAGEGFGCAAVRGLYVALEGRGNYVDVDAVGSDPYECANPSNFRTIEGASTGLDHTALRAADAWAAGGVGAPTLGSYFVGVDDAWDVYFDATNVPRTNELSAPVRFAIGGATTSDDEGLAAWTSRDALGAPVLGVSPPQCVGAACPPLSSVREPALYVPLDEETRSIERSTQGWLAAARELDGSNGRRFGIDLHPMGLSPFFVADDAMPVLRPDTEGGGCTSLRDPLLLPAGPHPTTTFWLLYGCERTGTLREIRMARVDVDGGVRATLPSEVVLDADDFGDIAAITLRGADGASWFPNDDEDLAIHRLWVVARDLAGRTSVAFAESAAPRDEPPRFVPYAANPVLRASDPVLGACPGRCDIESIAAARIANSPQRVRLLVGRTITTATEVRHTLLPLDQVWPQ